MQKDRAVTFALPRADRGALAALPWTAPLEDWPALGVQAIYARRGESRHTVLFVEAEKRRYAIKETSPEVARKEISQLLEIRRRGIYAEEDTAYIAQHYAALRRVRSLPDEDAEAAPALEDTQDARPLTPVERVAGQLSELGYSLLDLSWRAMLATGDGLASLPPARWRRRPRWRARAGISSASGRYWGCASRSPTRGSFTSISSGTNG